ncbi:hypothetical protein, partial [Campylobacter ureolyticus]|uniref:hypothetical protein n=1 Tax=Campylobacter ureolyticus TaxID=827 RepID=UPI0022B56FA8
IMNHGVGLGGNYAFNYNSNALTISSPKKGAFVKTNKGFNFKLPTPKTKKAFNISPTYHDKSMWAYIIKKDKNNKEFTTTNRALDFEMITSDKVLKLRLRNADVKDTTLENIDITSSGITVHGTKIGDIYKPNQWREVSIIALAVG